MDAVFLGTGLGLVNAGAAWLIGGRMLLVTHRLGGPPAAGLLGGGLLALGGASALLGPSLGPGFDAFDAERLFLQVIGFTAIALGYLLHARHGDSPERGFALAYASFVAVVAAMLAPFVAFAVLYPVLRAWDQAVYALTAAMAAAVLAQLLRGPGRAGRGPAAAAFGLFAAGQVSLAIGALDWTPADLWGVVGGVFRLAGLAVLGVMVLRPASSAERGAR